MIQSICVFCGSAEGATPVYMDAARTFARAAVRRRLRLVYGGASVGLMGALADAALEAGGTVIGIMPRALVDREIAHRGLTALHVVETMHERKALMAELADAFVALPGGLGTLEELFEVWTWGMLGLHDKPFAMLDVNGYYASLAMFLDHAHREGFIRAAQRGRLIMDDEPERLLARLVAREPNPLTGPS
ncbi:MAG TPA: TIGR00730 family Rossman fold protein [Gemmatimonadaceae bacterium]|nr:TIGR00730 family Rossman fold protein [Gemmatimonadaceae bacterium]